MSNLRLDTSVNVNPKNIEKSTVIDFIDSAIERVSRRITTIYCYIHVRQWVSHWLFWSRLKSGFNGVSTQKYIVPCHRKRWYPTH